jgi:hypothetical protein
LLPFFNNPKGPAPKKKITPGTPMGGGWGAMRPTTPPWKATYVKVTYVGYWISNLKRKLKMSYKEELILLTRKC